jgi:predicted RNA binding protein YcfA (HicA-like mRNA interferase family)
MKSLSKKTMKRNQFIKYLRDNGCYLLREGKKHSVFVNSRNNRVSTVPRHREIDDFLAAKICKDLDIDIIK